MEYDERCLRCAWFDPAMHPPCGRIFEAQIHITPHGGTVNISITPGMIPEEMDSEVRDMLGRIFERVCGVIDAWPGWRKILDIQLTDAAKADCPGRKEAVERCSYLRVVQ